jgi:ferredoxin
MVQDMPKVSFEMESVTVEIPEGQTIWHAARKAGILLQRGFAAAYPCDGNGYCSGAACAVFLRTGVPDGVVSPPTWKERFLHRKLLKNRKRLACQCVPQRDLTVVTMP